MGTDAPDARLELVAGVPSRLKLRRLVEVAVEIADVSDKRCVLEALALSAAGSDAQDEAPERRREDVLSLFDGIVDVTQLMRQADQPDLAMDVLGADEVGRPHVRAGLAHDVGGDLFCSSSPQWRIA